MVKQFSNGALDNIYTFIFKWVDFGKILIEVFWAFLEIWSAFFMIFYNMFMYVYYLFLFIIDRGAEKTQPFRYWRKFTPKKTSAPTIRISDAPNPIPAAYRSSGSTAGKGSSAAPSTSSIGTPSRNFSAASGGKKNILKTILEFFADLFIGIKDAILKPGKILANFFANRLKPVKEDDHPAEPQKRSLIDDYMKEYEQTRK